MLRRQAEKLEFWRWVLVEFERSGLSVREFCRLEGILEPSFYSWRKRIAQLHAGSQEGLPKKIAQLKAGSQEGFPKLTPVRVVPGPSGNEMVVKGTIANGSVVNGSVVNGSVVNGSVANGPGGFDSSASISASFSDKPPVLRESKSKSDSAKSDSSKSDSAKSDSAKSDSFSALASEPVMSAMVLTGVVPSPQIEVATRSGLLVRIGQACSLTLIERTLLAIENVYHDKPYGQPCHQAYGQPCHQAYSQPCEQAYGQPCDQAYGQPCDQAYGQPEEATSSC